VKQVQDIGLRCDKQVYIIAEIGLNHNGDPDLAKKLIRSASRAGVDAVKFQTYLTDKRVPPDSGLRGILRKCELAFSEFSGLKACAEEAGVDFFSTPFDEESVSCLEQLGCTIYKIASFDVVNHQLLRRVAATGKTVLMSTGMASLQEIDKAYKLLCAGTRHVGLLHCVSSYPLRPHDANLRCIATLSKNFDCVVGYSDHTPGIEIPLLAVAAGAQIIEKHFRIDETMECVDAPVSITEVQMRELVEKVGALEKTMGSGELAIRAAERGAMALRRPSQ
jgi:sialic acid synthase SpsE